MSTLAAYLEALAAGDTARASQLAAEAQRGPGRPATGEAERPLRVRVSVRTAEALAQAAHESGLPLAELVRRALRAQGYGG